MVGGSCGNFLNNLIQVFNNGKHAKKREGIMPAEKLYHQIDQEEDMTDEEKRETYFAEIENEEDREGWENGNHGR